MVSRIVHEGYPLAFTYHIKEPWQKGCRPENIVVRDLLYRCDKYTTAKIGEVENGTIRD